jgi:hypothetical protein
MRTRTTLLLLLLTALVGGAVFYMDQWATPTKVKELTEWKPFAAKPDQVDQVTLETSSQTLSFKVKDLFWRCSAPVEDVVDPDQINALVRSVLEAEWLEKVDPDTMDSNAWKLTGLAEPVAHLTLRGAGVSVAECWVGHESALEGSCYVSIPRPMGKGRLHYVAKTGLAALVKTAPEQWRDTRLLNMPEEGVSVITLRNGPGLIELRRDKPKAPWAITKPLQARGSNERINELLAVILELKIKEVSANQAGQQEAVSPDALRIAITTPALPKPIEVVVEREKADTSSIECKASVSHRSGRYVVTHERLDQLWSKLNALRDEHLARVSTPDVYVLAIQSQLAGEVVMRKNGDYWVVFRQGQWVPANGDRLVQLFKELNEHQVIAFASDSAANLEPYGLNKPFLTLSWAEGTEQEANAPLPATADNAFRVEPTIRTMRELAFAAGTDGKWFAKYDDEPFVYQVSPQLLNVVPRDNARWKSLSPGRFTQFSLKQISLAVGTSPPVNLNYDPTTAHWSGNVAEKDISPLIDRVKADSLVGRIAELKVEDWLQDRSAAAKALESPAITLRVTLLEDPFQPAGPTKLVEYNFAPTQVGVDTPIYYGRINNDPDLFVIMRDQLRQVIASPLNVQAGKK